MAGKRRSGGWRWLVTVSVVAATGYVGWRWYQNRSKEPETTYRTATVGRGDITQTVTANGQINAVKMVAVGSQVSGIITAINVDFNSQVTNGQVIAQIDPSTYRQNITQAEAELANARAGLELAELNHRRAKALVAEKLIPASEYDQTLVALHQAEAVVKMREASLQKARVDLERTTIYAPTDGIVISRVVDVGQTVAASFNAPTLFTIANDLRHMRIEAMISEADVGGVSEGQAVTFSVDAFPSRKFRGDVTQVRFAPITNQNVVNYIAVVDVNNEDLKLRPGMTANASVILAEKTDVLRIPNAALRFRPPDDAMGGLTNNPAARTNQLASAAGGPGDVMRSGAPGGGGGPGGDPARREEMRRRFENMSPEEREQFRERMRSRGMGMGMGPGGSRASQEGPTTRTVYMLAGGLPAGGAPVKRAGLPEWLTGGKPPEKQELKPVTIKTGISDGSFTEVVEGLKEGDVVVSGVELPAAETAAKGPAGSPFGGPPFGRGMRPR